MRQLEQLPYREVAKLLNKLWEQGNRIEETGPQVLSEGDPENIFGAENK
jgi:hypothetical protein